MSVLDVDQVIADFWYQQFHKRNPNYVVNNDSVVVEMLEFTYDKVEAAHTPHLIASSTFSNGTDAQATQTFSDSKSTTSSFKWSLQEGLKIGAKTTFKVGVPFVADGKVEASAELNVGSTQEWTTTVSQNWSYSAQVPVPPHTRVVASVIVTMAEYSPGWRMRLQVSGKTELSVPGYPGVKAVRVADLLKGLPGVQVVQNGDAAVVVASGAFKGVQGVSSEVTTKQSPYDVSAVEVSEILTGVQV
ncbi:ETX/MTX2 family pore-forming toxin [Agromyces sp. SYSU K20354]|uniref:ETX/MTX2 family pore-forming toxin n=1 Tax=Agromyces cavernae TaxID=2898659 RepID=UPI001E614E8C|nr:ETX/MTX2 family pore-forming toxin [Agromyces cavernae]MCD2441143.1 ETX/MTX2 family pore-forming toxin [Agromyces cavernae]